MITYIEILHLCRFRVVATEPSAERPLSLFTIRFSSAVNNQRATWAQNTNISLALKPRTPPTLQKVKDILLVD